MVVVFLVCPLLWVKRVHWWISYILFLLDDDFVDFSVFFFNFKLKFLLANHSYHPSKYLYYVSEYGVVGMTNLLSLLEVQLYWWLYMPMMN